MQVTIDNRDFEVPTLVGVMVLRLQSQVASILNLDNAQDEDWQNAVKEYTEDQRKLVGLFQECASSAEVVERSPECFTDDEIELAKQWSEHCDMQNVTETAIDEYQD